MFYSLMMNDRASHTLPRGTYPSFAKHFLGEKMEPTINSLHGKASLRSSGFSRQVIYAILLLICIILNVQALFGSSDPVEVYRRF